jgi:hydroxylamine reductase
LPGKSSSSESWSDQAFFLWGCDGARVGRNYYTEFVEKSPDDTVILTLACGKFRFNDMKIGEIGGIPRMLDMGQCNDSYGAIQVALALANAFDCSVNELPLSFILSWYEQKAVCVLLTLLHLGVKNIHLGPSLPACVSPNVLKILVVHFGIKRISTADADQRSCSRCGTTSGRMGAGSSGSGPSLVCIKSCDDCTILQFC